MPQVMFHWFCGTVNAKGIRCAVNELIESNKNNWNYTKKQLIRSMVFSLFDPQKFAYSMKINTEGLAFMRECIKQGHRLYILSNWDGESFDYIRLRFKEFFELFDGIIISGHVGHVKPDPTIFSYLLDKHDLDPESTVFIDDQAENLRTAEALGIYSIKCPKIGRFSFKGDFQSVRKLFERWQIGRRLAQQQNGSRSYPLF